MILNPIQQNSAFQHHILRFFLLKTDRIDKEQTVFEQLTSSDFKKWSCTA